MCFHLLLLPLLVVLLLSGWSRPKLGLASSQTKSSLQLVELVPVPQEPTQY